MDPEESFLGGSDRDEVGLEEQQKYLERIGRGWVE